MTSFVLAQISFPLTLAPPSAPHIILKEPMLRGVTVKCKRSFPASTKRDRRREAPGVMSHQLTALHYTSSLVSSAAPACVMNTRHWNSDSCSRFLNQGHTDAGSVHVYFLTWDVIPLASSKCSDMKMLKGERGRLGFPRFVNSWKTQTHSKTLYSSLSVPCRVWTGEAKDWTTNPANSRQPLTLKPTMSAQETKTCLLWSLLSFLPSSCGWPSSWPSSASSPGLVAAAVQESAGLDSALDPPWTVPGPGEKLPETATKQKTRVTTQMTFPLSLLVTMCYCDLCVTNTTWQKHIFIYHNSTRPASSYQSSLLGIERLVKKARPTQVHFSLDVNGLNCSSHLPVLFHEKMFGRTTLKLTDK